ncbi:MAG TPA: SDR family oxidoreductase [Pyrinomonadaceae bacterium]|jgi:NAD(P)-dependent dehydrogenase (short-subunit alcohol dehydrogenase family)|nr:SDR family oxidoreductase [Pyrinomonadaceae bacterium]
MDQTERVAIVTGANRGIGLEVVHQLAQLGFRVFLGSRDLEKGRPAATSLGEAHVEPVQLDVTNQSTIDRLAATIDRRYGRLDVLVNNAGILYDSWERVANVDFTTVHDAFETNTIGAWRMALAFIPLLKKSAHGRIVNVSSESGSLASMSGETPAYSISKLALNGLTKMLAAELKSSRIIVNAVCPGWVATEMGGADAPRTVEEGAASVVWAVTIPDDGPTGGFFRDGRPLSM